MAGTNNNTFVTEINLKLLNSITQQMFTQNAI